MKKTILALLVLCTSGIFAQNKEEMAVKKTVTDFFEAFHQKDTLAMKSFMAKKVVLQTTGKDKDGKTLLQTAEIEQLYRNIASIPADASFKEKLTSWHIQVDRTMANAWVGYEFWFNGKLSHCGINSFQLINFDGVWKIIYLIDTRGRQDCN